MGKYIVQKAASEDLRKIGRYTQEKWGVEQRKRYIGQLKDRLEALAENPRIGRARDDIEKGLRSAKQGRHLIFYEAVKSGTSEQVAIIRVIHESMDVAGELGRDAR